VAAELHPLQRYLNAREAAQYLGVSRACVYRWAEEGRLPHYKVGGILRFKLAELEEWMGTHRGPLLDD
jgi:excisionase family DNA binding protein